MGEVGCEYSKIYCMYPENYQRINKSIELKKDVLVRPPFSILQ